MTSVPEPGAETKCAPIERHFDLADADSRVPAIHLIRHALARLDEAKADHADVLARLDASPAYKSGGGMQTPASRQWDSLFNAATSLVSDAEDAVVELVLTAMGRVNRVYGPESVLDESLPVSFEVGGRHLVVNKPSDAEPHRLQLLVIDANRDFDSSQFGRGPDADRDEEADEPEAPEPYDQADAEPAPSPDEPKVEPPWDRHRVVGPLIRDLAETYYEAVRTLAAIDDDVPDDEAGGLGFYRAIAWEQRETARVALARMAHRVFYGDRRGDDRDWEAMVLIEDYGPHFLITVKPGRDENDNPSYSFEHAVVDVLPADTIERFT